MRFIIPIAPTQRHGAEPEQERRELPLRRGARLEHASAVSIARPSDVSKARAAASSSRRSCSGSARWHCSSGRSGSLNIMVISVLERRGEIGRRALGATRRHIIGSVQFLAESALLAAIGGAAGLAIGAGATEVYAVSRHEPFIVPLYALIAAPAAGFVIGALAGLYPAFKAARLSPTEALRA